VDRRDAEDVDADHAVADFAFAVKRTEADRAREPTRIHEA
jgi:hypothetical protein